MCLTTSTQPLHLLYTYARDTVTDHRNVLISPLFAVLSISYAIINF